MKDYLRELPYPLITKQLYEAVLESMATRPLRMGAAGCENDQADAEHTVSLLDNLPEVERVRTAVIGLVRGDHCGADNDSDAAALLLLLRGPLLWVILVVRDALQYMVQLEKVMTQTEDNDALSRLKMLQYLTA